MCVNTYIPAYVHVYVESACASAMEWLRSVGSLKLYVSFAKAPYKRDDILQKRPVILSIVLTIATPYLLSFPHKRKYQNVYIHTCMYVHIYMCVYIYICIYMCVCIEVNIKMYRYMHECMYIFICVCVYICTFICVCVYIYIYIYVHIHVCISNLQTYQVQGGEDP